MWHVVAEEVAEPSLQCPFAAPAVETPVEMRRALGTWRRRVRWRTGAFFVLGVLASGCALLALLVLRLTQAQSRADVTKKHLACGMWSRRR